jgi:hypothetical protein
MIPKAEQHNPKELSGDSLSRLHGNRASLAARDETTVIRGKQKLLQGSKCAV